MAKQENDAYFTRPYIARICTKFLIGQIGSDFTFIEPSAGNGDFVDALYRTCGKRAIAYDIHPRRDDIRRKDWLQRTSPLKGKVIFGNPPFGFACNTAIKFINKAAELGAEYIAFIVPRTFLKRSIHDRVDTGYSILAQLDIPEDSFYIPQTGARYSCNCVFLIWHRESRSSISLEKNMIYSFEKDMSDNVVALRRVGGRAGNVVTEASPSKSTTYFIKPNRNKEDLLNKGLRRLDLSKPRRNVTSVKSISKSELYEGISSSLPVFTPTRGVTFTASVKIDKLTPGSSSVLLRDNRILGILAPRMLEARLRNVSVKRVRSQDILLIALPDRTLRCVCRVSRSGTFDLCPSFMKGANRKFDNTVYKKFRRLFDGYVLVDVSQFPRVSAKVILNQDEDLPRRRIYWSPT